MAIGLINSSYIFHECAQSMGSQRVGGYFSKEMLKVLQARLQQYVNREMPDVQAGFREGRGTRDQTANIHWIIDKRISEKHLLH